MPTPFAPYDPGPTRRRKGRAPRLRKVPLRLILPNLVTILALSAGLTALRMALEGRFDTAIFLIVIAAFLDAVDGRIARILRGTSRFGAELDSLADFVNFGVAPVIVLYQWSLHEISAFGWTVALVFAIAMALRLARFNVTSENREQPAWQDYFFAGIPAPSGALVVLLPLYLELAGLTSAMPGTLVVAGYTLCVAAMVVSHIPTWSGKKFATRIRRDLVLPLLMLAVGIVAIFVSFPFWMLTFLSLCYLGSLPFSARAGRRMSAAQAPRNGSADKNRDIIKDSSQTSDQANNQHDVSDERPGNKTAGHE